MVIRGGTMSLAVVLVCLVCATYAQEVADIVSNDGYRLEAEPWVVRLWLRTLGAIQVLRNAFFWKLDIHPPPCNDINVEKSTGSP